MSIINNWKVLTISDENESEELVHYTEWNNSKAKIFIIFHNRGVMSLCYRYECTQVSVVTCSVRDTLC